MKVTLTIQEVELIQAVINNTPRQKTNIGALLRKEVGKGRDSFILQRNAIIGKYEEDITETKKDEEGKETTTTHKGVPKEKVQEVNDLIFSIDIEIEFSPLTRPAFKQAYLNFPNIIVDKEGNKGIVGIDGVIAYEDLKRKLFGEANDQK